jgi:succinate dehydrogenase / fumarate reductase membrane anchor subunit
MQAAIGKVRSRGSARSGAGTWKAQRFTAIANLLLVLWFVVNAIAMAGSAYAEWVAWMILLVLSTCYHARIGLQEVVEDYVHHEIGKVAILVGITLVAALLATAGVVSVLMIALGG